MVREWPLWKWCWEKAETNVSLLPHFQEGSLGPVVFLAKILGPWLNLMGDLL